MAQQRVTVEHDWGAVGFLKCGLSLFLGFAMKREFAAQFVNEFHAHEMGPLVEVEERGEVRVETAVPPAEEEDAVLLAHLVACADLVLRPGDGRFAENELHLTLHSLGDEVGVGLGGCAYADGVDALFDFGEVGENIDCMAVTPYWWVGPYGVGFVGFDNCDALKFGGLVCNVYTSCTHLAGADYA